ncbi:MAG: sigma 54-interacting transcriptional regulator, partial [Alphaproteobacteria bacterium]|nr:sigma 54-interacting transcriptional regulator [Alphaproteobacteria bacterium]
KANVRIIAATHRDLRNAIRQGLFREDLFYRLNVVPIRLPPLRDKPEDIAELAHHYLRKAASDGLPEKVLAPEALALMRGYRWPGNVRELENLVRRLAALYSQEVITSDIIEAELAEQVSAQVAPAAPMTNGAAVASPSSVETLTEAVERHLRDYFAAHREGLPPNGLYDRILADMERPLLALTLGATRGNQVKAAQLLGLNRNTLRKKIRELDVQVVRSPR